MVHQEFNTVKSEMSEKIGIFSLHFAGAKQQLEAAYFFSAPGAAGELCPSLPLTGGEPAVPAPRGQLRHRTFYIPAQHRRHFYSGHSNQNRQVQICCLLFAFLALLVRVLQDVWIQLS